jgi:hypothetical protein
VWTKIASAPSTVEDLPTERRKPEKNPDEQRYGSNLHVNAFLASHSSKEHTEPCFLQ